MFYYGLKELSLMMLYWSNPRKGVAKIEAQDSWGYPFLEEQQKPTEEELIRRRHQSSPIAHSKDDIKRAEALYDKYLRMSKRP
ncbi:hypothetical protein ACFO4L_01175 [Bacillus daqingensis]|uniref:Uncharacterized protein n=1 Tax=Bacillus daqingensis TaxID=872396 RepID=A0ABV9NPR3_9BACI